MFITKCWQAYARTNLILLIIIGLVLGTVLALLAPETARSFGVLGELFVNGLKAVAPLLVMVLVTAATAQHKKGTAHGIRFILFLYILATFLAALVAVGASFLFPTELVLSATAADKPAPDGIAEVIRTLVFSLVDNPINALLNANYIGILMWAVLLGLAFRHASDATKSMLDDLAKAVTSIVGFVVKLAPFGLFGLMAQTVADNGVSTFASYLQLLALLLGCMFFVAFIVNPIIVFLCIRRNPYPLVWKTITTSALMAFFMRSSAANIPVNMKLCEELELDEDIYSISIPIGATINMGGAAITISILSLAAANTVGIDVDFGSALLLCIVSTLAACGASGVAGGSLLLIPLACALFGMDNDIAMKVVGIGFIIGVLQDSCETALNSSTDVLFTAAADIRGRRLGINKAADELQTDSSSA